MPLPAPHRFCHAGQGSYHRFLSGIVASLEMSQSLRTGPQKCEYYALECHALA
jgi:hypothetical protein